MPSDHDDRATAARDPILVRAEADIAETRAQVALSINQLQHEIARTVDWRQWVGRKPGLAIGLAFGLGLLLGRIDGQR